VDTDSAEFTEFYRAARDNCLRAVFASVGDRQAAEDLVAEAFARAWANWSAVRRHPAPRAWVMRTALTALLRLPVRQRQVVALRLFLDLDTGATAEVLGIAPGTVTAHLARAIAALREEFSPSLTRSCRHEG
jgi:DNA-directed RNA polymerase specialized sigma24 family protein